MPSQLLLARGSRYTVYLVLRLPVRAHWLWLVISAAWWPPAASSVLVLCQVRGWAPRVGWRPWGFGGCGLSTQTGLVGEGFVVLVVCGFVSGSLGLGWALWMAAVVVVLS